MQIVRVTRLVLLAFLLAQACDGILTYLAVRSDGIAAEGNMLLSTWMVLVGPAPTLFTAKILAAACGVLLYARGVHRILAALTIFYAVSAVGPWILIFGAR
jgi:hypothetical protein